MEKPVVLVDECCTPKISELFNSKGYRTIRPKNGLPDEEVKQLAKKHDAYIITRDKTGFTDYEKTLLLQGKDKPFYAYQKLIEMFKI